MTDVVRPLRGVRVLSFADLYPGPFATTILSDLGAEVIQVERVEGTVMRSFPALFKALNRGSSAVSLDLKDPRSVQACLAVADTIDIVLEGFRPGVMDRLGLGAEAFREQNPAITYVSISGFGQSGTLASRPGHDIIYQAAAGTLSDGTLDSALPHLALADQVAGLYAVIAALAGVASTSRGDAGRHHDVAMTDSLVSVIGPQIVQALSGKGADRLRKDPGYGVYETLDGGRIALGIAYEDNFWEEFARIAQIDATGYSHDARVREHDRIEGLIVERFSRMTTRQWLALLEGSDVPFAVVHGMREVPWSPHVRERNLVDTVSTLPGSTMFVRQPIVIDGDPLGPIRDADGLGCGTQGFLADAGYTSSDIALMVADGAATISAPTA